MEMKEETSLCPSCKGYHKTKMDFHFPAGGPLLREPKIKHLCTNCGACTHETGGEWRLYKIVSMIFFPSLAILAWSALFTQWSAIFQSSSGTTFGFTLTKIALYLCIGSACAFAILIYRDILRPAIKSDF